MANVSVTWQFNRKGLGLINSLKSVVSSSYLDWLGKEALKTIEPHVPLRGGDLRRSGRVDRVDRFSNRVHLTWDAKIGSADLPDYINKNDSYARYIYEGVVYGPNRRNKDGLWYSAASEKVSENRPMSYHTPGTQDHWDRVIQPGGVEYDAFRDAIKDELKNTLTLRGMFRNGR